MKTLQKDLVIKALDEINTRVLVVTFLKKDGSLKTYSGRINVTKGVKGNDLGKLVSDAFKAQGRVPLKTCSGEYKSFLLDSVVNLKSGSVVLGGQL